MNIKLPVNLNSPHQETGEQIQISASYLADLEMFPPLRPGNGNLIPHQLSPTSSFLSSLPKDPVLPHSNLPETHPQAPIQSVPLQENQTPPAINQGLASPSLEKPSPQTENSKVEPLQKAVNESEIPPRPILSNQKNPKEGPRNICRYLEKGICWFGAWGLEGGRCRNFHPEPCDKYLEFGEVLPHGCNKRVNCKYKHLPFFCQNSYKYLWCNKKNCKYFHHMSCNNSEFCPQSTLPSPTPSITSTATHTPSISMSSSSPSPPPPTHPSPNPTPNSTHIQQNETPLLAQHPNFLPHIPNYYPPPLIAPSYTAPPVIPPHQSNHPNQIQILHPLLPPPRPWAVISQQQFAQQMSSLSRIENFITKMKAAS